MEVRRPIVGKIAVALGAAGLLLAPAFAADQSKKRPAAVSLSFSPDLQFTPASADPRLAATHAGRSPAVADFKFTPAASKARPSQVRVAIRARSSSPQQLASNNGNSGSSTAAAALAPVTYNLGVAVGWRRFAVSGDVGKIKAEGAPVDGRESAAVAVSYSLPRFTGRVALSADRSEGRAAPALRDRDNVALDVGGSYAITRRISVTGGVRYKTERERLPALDDERVDSQAVYVGTAFKF